MNETDELGDVSQFLTLMLWTYGNLLLHGEGLPSNRTDELRRIITLDA